MIWWKKNRLFRNEVGQILLVVILVVIVASTIGLSLASKTITGLRSSREEAESQKALAAAEAGIERILQSKVPVAVNADNSNNKSSYLATADAVLSSAFLINAGNLVLKDEGADVWFINHTANGDPDYSSGSYVDYKDFLHLYWGSASDNCADPANMPAAIEAIVITRNKVTGGIKSYRYVYDSCPGRSTGSSGNNFSSTDLGSFTVPGISGITFANRTPENGVSTDLAKGLTDIVLMRVVPIYKNTTIAVYACSRAGINCTTMPLQGYKITSDGTAGQAKRRLTVFKGYPQIYLPYLSYGLFVAN